MARATLRIGCAATLAVLALLTHGDAAADPVPYPWLATPTHETIERRLEPPAGFQRTPAAPHTFAAWLRGLPVKPGRPAVLLYDGRPKANQQAHQLVLDVDVGHRDLQQCADAVMRLRAEYLRATEDEGNICFRFTSGAEARWSRWREGYRPQRRGQDVTWEKTAASDGSYASFRRYLDVVFGYAGSASLAQELERVSDPAQTAGLALMTLSL